MRKIDRQLAWLDRQFPDLRATPSQDGELVFIDGAPGRIEVPVIGEPRAAAHPDTTSYLDPGRGLLVVRERGYFIYAQMPRDAAGSRLSPHQVALLAVLLERRGDRERVVLPSRIRDLQQLLETIIGVKLNEMAVRRFQAAIEDVTVESERRDTRIIGRADALDRLRASVRERTLGTTQRFATRGREQVIDVVDRIGSPAIHGVSAFLRDLGAVPGEDDLIVSRDALPALGDMLGRPVKPDYPGPTVLVRTPSHVKIPVLAGKAGRRQLNPLLAHAAALTMEGPVRDLAEAWSAEPR